MTDARDLPSYIWQHLQVNKYCRCSLTFDSIVLAQTKATSSKIIDFRRKKNSRSGSPGILRVVVITLQIFSIVPLKFSCHNN